MALSFEEIQEIITLGTEHRGWISNSFAQVEYLLGDLIVRCRQFPEYDDQTKTVSHSASTRVSKVTAMLKIDGPLTPFADELREVMEAFSSNQEVRNLLAHGYCEFHYTPTDDAGLVFRKFDRARAEETGDDAATLVRTFRLVDLEYHSTQQIAQTDRAITLLAKIHSAFGWSDGSPVLA